MDAQDIRPGSWRAILAPLILVFLASACVLSLEIVASRIIARHVGSSLYTWTSIIGVVLGGLSLGNLLGGLLADRLPERRLRPALGIIFLAASLLCLAVLWLHWRSFDLPMLSQAPWSLRLVAGVMLCFFLPSLALGLVSPIVAKWAVEHGRGTGLTLGRLYACESLGAISGVFLTGFVLIAAMGSAAVICLLALVLAGLAVLVWRAPPSLAWLAGVAFLMAAAVSPDPWLKSIGASLNLREEAAPGPFGRIYIDENEYSRIEIWRRRDNVFTVKLDDLIHGYYALFDPARLDYSYLANAAVLVEAALEGRDAPLTALMIGGGAYTFPRYLLERHPGSDITVVEIDPGVTRANMEATALPDPPPFRIIHRDARVALADMARSGDEADRFDLILNDGFRNDRSVPYQLTTRTFMEQQRTLLAAEGLLVMNVIDTLEAARFLGAMANTLEAVFPHVAVVTDEAMEDGHDRPTTFLLAASHAPLPLERAETIAADRGADFYVMDEDIRALVRARSRGLVLTDDFAPVEHLLSAWQTVGWW